MHAQTTRTDPELLAWLEAWNAVADEPRCCTTVAAVQLCRCEICGTFFRCQSGTETNCGNHGR